MYNIIHFTLRMGLLYKKMRFDLWLLEIQTKFEQNISMHTYTIAQLEKSKPYMSVVIRNQTTLIQ